MIKNITKGEYKFGSPEWDDISELPKDLVSIKGSPDFHQSNNLGVFERQWQRSH